MRALIYARLSRAKDPADGVSGSIERQETVCRAYAEAQGWEVLEVQHDDDTSGWSGARQPGLEKLRARFPEADVLLAYRIDRYARRTLSFLSLVSEAKSHGVKVASATEPIDTDSPLGNVMLTIVAAFAEMEAEANSQRVAAALDAKAQSGKFTGGPEPYGFRAVDHPSGSGKTLVLHEEQSLVLLEIIDRVLARESLMSIGGDMVARGEFTNGESTTLVRMLSNPRLIGHLLRKGEVLRGDDGLPIIANEPLITMERWAELQGELERRKQPKGRPRQSNRVLTGHVLCASCERPMVTNRFRDKQGRERVYYRCQKGNRPVHDRCEAPALAPADALEAYVYTSKIERHLKMPLIVRRGVVTDPHAEEREKLAHSLETLESDRMAGIYDSPAATERFRAQHRKLTEKLSALPDPQPNETVDTVEGTVGDLWESGEDGQRMVLNTLLHDILVARGREDLSERVSFRYYS